MTKPRPRSAMLAAMFALCAVLCMSALGGWHAATFHHDAPVHAMAATSNDADPTGDDAIHVAAHAIGHAFAVPADAAPTHRLADAAGAWPTHHGVAPVGIDPASLLRPPRA